MKFHEDPQDKNAAAVEAVFKVDSDSDGSTTEDDEDSADEIEPHINPLPLTEENDDSDSDGAWGVDDNDDANMLPSLQEPNNEETTPMIYVPPLFVHILRARLTDDHDNDSDGAWGVDDNNDANMLPSLQELPTPNNEETTIMICVPHRSPPRFVHILRARLMGDDAASSAASIMHTRQLAIEEVRAYGIQTDSTSIDTASPSYQRQLDEANRREEDRAAMNEDHLPLPWDG